MTENKDKKVQKSVLHFRSPSSRETPIRFPLRKKVGNDVLCVTGNDYKTCGFHSNWFYQL